MKKKKKKKLNSTYSNVTFKGPRTIIDRDSFGKGIFKNCKFIDIQADGAPIESTFVDCTFENICWYWAIGHSARFVNCTFKKSDLRGSFFTTIFLECTFEDCKTGEDNLGGETTWEGSEAVDCSLLRTELPIVPETNIY
jgi:hypothetical protein